MKIALVNCDIEWESPAINLANFDKILSNFINEGVNKPDLIVFPELFTTGFSVSDRYAESLNGDTHKWMKGWSIRLDSAIMASIPVQEGDNLYNRALFVTPEDDFHYDKRHLFSLGGEQSLFKKGRTPVIINFRGFNIFLQICYDLRFPVWSRNAGLLYDLTINIANWPASRDSVIEILVDHCNGKEVNFNNYRKVSDKEIENEIKKIISNKKDLSPNAVMGIIMSKYKGKVEGKKVFELINKNKA